MSPETGTEFGATNAQQNSDQHGFLSTSLGLLTSETHPESGTTTYAYDAKGNLTSRTDARSVATSYKNYDALDRVGSISYSDVTTPTVTFSYDSTLVSYGRGRLTGRSDGAGTETFGYDKLGRPATQKRSNTSGPTLEMQYVYNLAGGLAETRFPGILDGAYALTVFQSFDNTGRTVSSGWSNGSTADQDLVDGYTFTYTANNGGTETTVLANGTIETVTYSIRLQPTRRLVRLGATPLMDLAYNFNRSPDGKNNGNVFFLDDDVVAGRDQTFGYDFLNRLTSAAGTGVWTNAYVYDRYGNLTSRTSTGTGEGNLTLAVSAASNRITTSGYSYDAAGNMSAAPGSKTYQYDAESRMKSANSGALGTYSYDAEGRRVKKVANGQTRYYFYDQEGRAIWEYVAGVGWETFNHYFHDRLAVVNSASAIAAPLWVCSDHLGSPRVKTNSLGSVVSRDWYFPYGEGWNPSNDGVKLKYTAKEKDSETALNYFGSRFSDGKLARFLTSDPLLASARASDPQTWNRYIFVRDNPIRYVDPDGEDFFDFVKGVGNGIGSSLFFQSRTSSAGKPIEYAVGQAIGDAASTATGLVLTAIGLNGAAGGTVVTVGTAGFGSPVGLPVAAAGAAVAAVGVVVAGHSAANLGESTANVANSVSESGRDGSLSKEAEKSIRSLEQRIAEHQKKLEEFKANPTVRPGMEGLSPEVIQQQQQARIRHLEREIEVFRENIEKIRRGEL